MTEDYRVIGEFARKMRLVCLEMVFQQKASHVGGALSIVDVLATLYSDYLKIEPEAPTRPDRDRLFYSKGHACTALYAALYLKGFFPKELLDSFTKNGSTMTSHVNYKIPGVEFSAGSLGHVLPVATGVALSSKIKKESFRTLCIVSDGELDEGSNWEAILFAGHHHLNNLTIIVDYNKIQSFGFTKDVLSLEPLADKFNAFNWHTIEIDGHDLPQISAALKHTSADKPKVIIAHTIKGKGIRFMENELKWHYKSPSAEEYALAIQEIKGSN